jgi:hypothetical protein
VGTAFWLNEYDPYIERIAVVTNEKWKGKILMFLGAGRRQAAVKFFLGDGEEDARDWLQSESE